MKFFFFCIFWLYVGITCWNILKHDYISATFFGFNALYFFGFFILRNIEEIINKNK